jgi:hypothetical protein
LSNKEDTSEIDWSILYKAVRQILDNQAIYFLNEQLNLTKESDASFKPDEDIIDDINENFNERITDFYENEEEFAEYIKDEDGEDNLDDIDDNYLFLEEESDEEEKESNESRTNIRNANYIKDLRKRIRSKLKKKKGEDKKNSL